ncbi:hypothetical protein [Larkinella terrae]|uniref:Uncharacterized protein n=1 Tax=Larkinella terrae TaxID=2025311 RepID=A0A7K0EDG0_9BACT|nr:hypothetical protein [Larkinella terrae]MRS59815.1 hypothetical protein [Larkinella terrae]
MNEAPLPTAKPCLICDDLIQPGSASYSTGICRLCKEALKEFTTARRRKK